jgi:hypothetical protein
LHTKGFGTNIQDTRAYAPIQFFAMTLFRQQADYLMRPSNKEIEYPGLYEDLFDQLIQYDQSGNSTNSSDQSNSESFDSPFDLSASSSGTDPVGKDIKKPSCIHELTTFRFLARLPAT